MRSSTARSLLVAACLAGCGEESAPEPAVPLPGGATTVFDRTSNAFSFPAPNLGAEELERHLDGDVAFEATFVTPPAPVNGGLGPVFNSSSCARCHVRDGRGPALVDAGAFASPLLVRVSLPEGTPEVPGGAVPVPGLGTQIQDHAVWGEVPEATIALDWVEEPGSYADGTPYSLRRPVLSITLADGDPLPSEVLTSPRIPPPVFGLGLLEAIPEAAILALADPEDADGDGISGRPNLVWDVERGATVLGRFGWKANNPSLLQQTAGAYAEDMGVRSPLLPGPGGESEIDAETLAVATFYVQTLAVPAPDRWHAADVRAGARHFRRIGCAACHVEELSTGDHPIAALRDQSIRPYTDLLLHDMGPGLADGRPDFQASGSEWRTAPLWGLGLTWTVNPQATLLHDGRARTIEEAILWHGGEAEAAKEAFRALDAAARAELVAFLRAL